MADDRTYVKLDDSFYRNPKARAAGKDGRELYLASLCYSGHNLTDGFVSSDMLPILSAEAEVRPSTAKLLVTIGLWIDVENGWRIHDYHEHQRSAAEVDELRRKRQAAGSKGGLAKANGLASATANGKRSGSKPLPATDTDTEVTSKALGDEDVADPPRKSRGWHGSDNDPDFCAFWEIYPRKVGKGQARKAWRQAVLSDHVEPGTIVDAAASYDAQVRRTGTNTDFIAYPATWLNGERWNDEDTRPAHRGPVINGIPVVMEGVFGG